MWALIKWFKGPSNTGDQYVEVSMDNPLPVTTIGSGAGGAEKVTSDQLPTDLDSNGGLKVSVQNTAKWQGVGNILGGTVAQGEEKLIDLTPDGATAIWIQASPDNTSPILVGNMAGFEGAWVSPGASEWFYYPKLYLKHSDANTQNIAYQAVKYG